MGLFTPKMNQFQIQHVQGSLKQMEECAKLVDTTTNAEVFFGRLNFLLDIYLDLENYKKYRIFKGVDISKEFQSLTANLENMVNDFIDRAFEKELEKINSLKTEKAKKNRIQRFNALMMNAFEMSHTYYRGHESLPHYTGPLYCNSNIEHFKSIMDSLQQG